MTDEKPDGWACFNGGEIVPNSFRYPHELRGIKGSSYRENSVKLGWEVIPVRLVRMDLGLPADTGKTIANEAFEKYKGELDAALTALKPTISRKEIGEIAQFHYPTNPDAQGGFYMASLWFAGRLGVEITE